MSYPPVVVMGVSGAGKTTVAEGLAERIGGVYLDADDLHPASNIHKMANGVPLTDADRWPWLDAVGREMRERAAAGESVIMACSALKRAYRDRIRAIVSAAYFIELDAPVAVLHARLERRHGHFMPASLLDSQIATLQSLASDERGVTIDVSTSPDHVLELAQRAVESA